MNPQMPGACCHFKPLAAVAENRFSAQCEHSTIHLVWDHTVLQLSPGELEQAVVFLDRPHLGRRSGPLRIIADPDWGIQVWAHRRGILIDRRQLDDFTRLIHDTFRALAVPKPIEQRRRYLHFASNRVSPPPN